MKVLKSSALRVALCIGLSSLLGACSMFDKVMESGKVDYKAQAKRTPRLDLPPDLTLPAQTDRYAVPDTAGKGSATASAYNADRAAGPQAVPQASGVLPKVANMRIERAGSQRWLVVNATPDQLWPQVREFWQETGFLIEIEQPDAGVMETDWNENRARLPDDIIRNTIGRLIDTLYSTPERDKYRTRLEPGVEPGTTEIYVSHRGVMEVYVNERSDNTVWQSRPADPELEAEMLRRLMVRLGADNERAKAQVAAQTATAERAQLLAADKGSTLQVYEGFDRAWRRVGLALDRVGFTVEDRDRSQGVYFVRYVDPEIDATGKKDGGILSKLLFFMPDDKPDPKKGQSQYRVLVKGEGKQSTVQVLTREGGLDDSKTARRILGMLHEQLK